MHLLDIWFGPISGTLSLWMILRKWDFYVEKCAALNGAVLGLLKRKSQACSLSELPFPRKPVEPATK